ncbi:MAG: hypothetical protein Q8P61_03295, partial [Candidatus Nanopelagicales bacterium]|nr:hypothetical protein [Candidatus Nanopelagicales bacterium]
MVLAQIRGNRRARWLPVLMFDYAASEADVALSYAQGANAFATKPETLAGYVRFVEAIEQFWWGVARLPPDPAGLPKL